MEISKKQKKHKIFWTIVLFLLAVLLLEVGLRLYDSWHGQQRVKELAEELARIENDRQAKMAGDTIGGQTPQETLQLFISAVERGDYELASKYFVVEKQEEELNELIILEEKNNLDWLVNILKIAEPDGDIENGAFRMKSKTDLGPYYFIEFLQYPSGNWKIEEI